MSKHNISRIRKNAISKISGVNELPILFALFVLCLALSFLSPYFLTVDNVFNVLRQISIIGILAVGQAFIIITGGIDLSIGNVLGLTGVLAAIFISIGISPFFVFILVILCGCLISSINGILVTKVRINPFIATLGMMSIARGVALLITGGLPKTMGESSLNFLGGGYIGVVPVPVIIMFIVVISGYIFATKTLIGRNIFAVGSNERAAKLSGIRVNKTKMITYIIMGGLCGIGGMILAGTLKSAEPNAGSNYALDVVAAVVIGGTSLSGGEGSIIGVLIGAAIMGVMRNGFVLLGVSAYWQIVSIGIVIIAAVAIDSLKRKVD